MLNIQQADRTDIITQFEPGKYFDEQAFHPHRNIVDDYTSVALSDVVTSKDGGKERGLFTAIDITEGDYIGTYFGVVVLKYEPIDFSGLFNFVKSLYCYGDSEFVAHDPTYVVWGGGGGSRNHVGVDGKNKLRYSNHQHFLKSNMVVKGFNFYASRDIKRGEELTWPYGLTSGNNFEKDKATLKKVRITNPECVYLQQVGP